MPLSRRLARPLLASMFVYGGIDALRDPASKVAVAEKVTSQLPIDQDAELLVRANGAAQVAAGGLLAIGRLPRLSALVLAGSLVPTTVAAHRFWEEKDEGDKAAQTIHFLKNVSMMGGLLLAALDTEGRPSVTWRAKRAAGDAAERAGQLAPGQRGKHRGGD